MRLLVPCLLLIFVQFSNLEPTMVITFGAPQVPIEPSNSYSWEECLADCLSADDCMFVARNATSSCTIYRWESQCSVTKLASPNASHVAFKIDLNTTTCPAASETPVINGSAATSSVQTELSANSSLSFVPYSITFSQGVWSFEPSFCPDNYQFFQRELGPWCIKLTLHGACLNQSSAALFCSQDASGGVLSGIQTEEENTYVVNILGPVIPKRTVNTFATSVNYWMAGKRKETCMNLTKETSECDGINEFEIDDPTWKYPGYTDWYTGEPNGSTISNPENCLTMQMTGSVIQWADAGCNLTDTGRKDHCYLGSICGVKAQLKLS